jgi:hypothetical protein
MRTSRLRFGLGSSLLLIAGLAIGLTVIRPMSRGRAVRIAIGRWRFDAPDQDVRDCKPMARRYGYTWYVSCWNRRHDRHHTVGIYENGRCDYPNALRQLGLRGSSPRARPTPP